MGAGEGCQHPAGLEEAHGAEVDLFVAARGGLDSLAAAREGRRVQDDQAEAGPGALEPAELVEGVVGDDLGARRHPVEGEVLARGGDGLRRGLDADRAAGARHQRVTGEPGRVAEGIQHVTPLAQRAQVHPVLPLIQVEPGLLPRAEGDAETNTLLLHHDALGARLIQPAPRRVEPLEPGRPGIVGRKDRQRPDGGPERFDELLAPGRHAQGQTLDDHHGPVTIGDEARQAVRLAPDEPSQRGKVTTVAPSGQGLGDPSPEERGVHGLVLIGQDAATEARPWVEEAPPQEAATRFHHSDQAARRDRAHVRNVTLENPRMHARPPLTPPLQSQHRLTHAGAYLTRFRWAAVRARASPAQSTGCVRGGRPRVRSGARRPSEGGARPPSELLLAEDDDHQERMPRAFQHLMRLEAEVPLHELEAPGESDQRPQLLREHHPTQMRLPIGPACAVLERLQREALAEDLRHRVHVVERGERRPDGDPAPPSQP